SQGQDPRGINGLLVAVGVGQEGQIAGALDGRGQLPLEAGLGAGYAAGYDLAGLGNIAFQGFQVLVVDLGRVFSGKAAKFTSAIKAWLHDYSSSPDSSSASSSASCSSAASWAALAARSASRRSRLSFSALSARSAFMIRVSSVSASSSLITSLRSTASL